MKVSFYQTFGLKEFIIFNSPIPGLISIYTTAEILDRMYLLIDIPSSADFIARFLCNSGGTLKVRFPLYFISIDSAYGSNSQINLLETK